MSSVTRRSLSHAFWQVSLPLVCVCLLWLGGTSLAHAVTVSLSAPQLDQLALSRHGESGVVRRAHSADADNDHKLSPALSAGISFNALPFAAPPLGGRGFDEVCFSLSHRAQAPRAPPSASSLPAV